MTDTKHNLANVSKTEHDDKAEVELSAEVPIEEVEKHRVRAIKTYQEEVSVDGFRKGKAPEDVVIKHVGEAALMERTARLALDQELPLLLATEKIPAIAAPSVNITKLALGNPIAFSARIPVMPKVNLADYHKIAKAKNKDRKEVTVSEEEVQETITHLRRERAKIERMEQGMEPAKAAEEAGKLDTLELPGIDDAFVQTLGYKDAEDFQVKLKENIKNEKELQEKEKVRIQIIEDLIGQSTIPLPTALVEHELTKMEAQFSADIQQAGMKFDDYLKQAKKTREDLHTEWKEAAEKRAKMQLALAEVAQKEDIKADKETLDKHVEHAKKQHPDGDEAQMRLYYDQMLRNEAVLNYLEKQS